MTRLAALILVDKAKAKEELRRGLDETNGNIAELSRLHGVSRQTMYKYLAALGLAFALCTGMG
jgi:transcriptional regulator of acetoin/glycerol metabolism